MVESKCGYFIPPNQDKSIRIYYFKSELPDEVDLIKSTCTAELARRLDALIPCLNLSSIDRQEEALLVAEEAIDMYCSLAKRKPAV